MYSAYSLQTVTNIATATSSTSSRSLWLRCRAKVSSPAAWLPWCCSTSRSLRVRRSPRSRWHRPFLKKHMLSWLKWPHRSASEQTEHLNIFKRFKQSMELFVHAFVMLLWPILADSNPNPLTKWHRFSTNSFFFERTVSVIHAWPCQFVLGISWDVWLFP